MRAEAMVTGRVSMDGSRVVAAMAVEMAVRRERGDGGGSGVRAPQRSAREFVTEFSGIATPQAAREAPRAPFGLPVVAQCGCAVFTEFV